MKRSILFVADIHPNFSGQAIVSKNVYNIIKKHFDIYHVPLSYKNQNKASLLFKLNFLFRFIYQAYAFYITKSSKTVYYTPSRGSISIFRDLIILFFLRIINNKDVKIYAHLHGSDMKKSIDRSLFKSFLHYSYIKLKIKIILLSRGHKKFALGKTYKHYIYISNFVDNISLDKLNLILKKRSFNFKNINNKVKKISFIHISGVSKHKGLNYCILFIYYLNFFRDESLLFHLNIIGWSRSQFINIFPKLDRVLRELENKKMISFHGISNKSKIQKYFAVSHFNILLSKSEAQPLTLLEGACIGCYTITNKMDFIKDLMKDIDGKIINRNNIKEEARKFLYLLNTIDQNYFNILHTKVRNKKVLKNYARKKFEHKILAELI